MKFQKWAALLALVLAVVVSGIACQQKVVVIQNQCQSQSQNGSSATCGSSSPMGPSVSVPLNLSVTLAFARPGSGEVGCREHLIIQGTGFTPNKQIVIRITKSDGTYSDFPEPDRPKLFSDGAGSFQYLIEQERLDTGTFTLMALDASTGTWSSPSMMFTVMSCGRGNPGPRPTPEPAPGPTPQPTPTPAPTCGQSPSLSVDPLQGSKTTKFHLTVIGLCPGASVTWSISGIGTVNLSNAGPEGTSKWEFNASGSALGDVTVAITSGGKSASVTFKVTP